MSRPTAEVLNRTTFCPFWRFLALNQNTPWITEMDTRNSQIGKDIYIIFSQRSNFLGVPLTLIVGQLDKLPLTIFVPLRATLGFHQGNINHHH